MKKSIQDKIDAIIKQAQASNFDSSTRKGRSSISTNDSLAKAITNKKDAAIFLAELEAAIKLADEEK